MEARYPILLDGLAWDSVSLSFGEFSGADPEKFIDSTNLAYQVLQEQAPGTRMTATVHVGDTEDTRVEYMGEDIIYYFLVKWADSAIVPWIHTVMYYNLFESAGGAYHHEDFAEHRDYLLERLEAGEPVGSLEVLSEKTAALAARVGGISLPGGKRWIQEARQGFSVTAARLRFVHALYRAVVQKADSGDAGDWLEVAEGALEKARELVVARHADLHRPRPEQLLYGNSNATLYQWGYLKQTHELCYWERERLFATNALRGENETPPACIY